VIRAILLDLGNVLVGFDLARGCRALEGRCPHPEERIPEVIRAAGLVAPFERGEISSLEFFQRMSKALALEMSYEEFCRVWSTIFLPEPLVPEELVAALRRRYRTVLVSNTNDLHFRMIRQNYPILRHFDARVLSYRVGAMKPSERIYEEAVRQAGCRPEECFFADDVMEFVEAARRYRIDAVQFQGAARLVEELRRRGVEGLEISTAVNFPSSTNTAQG